MRAQTVRLTLMPFSETQGGEFSDKALECLTLAMNIENRLRPVLSYSLCVKRWLLFVFFFRLCLALEDSMYRRFSLHFEDGELLHLGGTVCLAPLAWHRLITDKSLSTERVPH